MDFQLNSDQLAIRSLAREFAEHEIAPFVSENDHQRIFDTAAMRKMGAVGLLGGPLPERYGGSGADYIGFGLCCEEVERADSSFREILSVHTALNSLTLLQWGTEEQKQRYLVPQARGERMACFGLTEPGAGSDVAALATTAKRDGERYILNGSKLWITLADHADNFLIFATLDRAKGRHAICAFLVEREFPGIRTGTITRKLGVHAGNTGEIVLEDCVVPRENLLGEEGEGFYIAMSALDWGRFSVAAGAVGLTQACLEAATAYARERQAFGREIARFQLVQQMIARMVAGQEASRLLVYRAGDLKNRGQRSTRETSLAKWFACDVALQSAGDAIEIHGAYGYSSEFPVERYWRNAKGATIYEGTREIHTIMQAEYALGFRADAPLRCPPPPAEGY